MSNDNPPSKKIVTFKDLKPKFGISYCRTHLDRMEDAEPPRFPRSFKLAPGVMARRVWWEHEVIAWLDLQAQRAA